METLMPMKQMWVVTRLKSERGRVLRDALRETVGKVGVQVIDRELHNLVNADALNKLGAFGLRGEVLFAVPCLIKEKPTISGYYRLVLGISQKEYGRRGLGKWIRIEKGESAAISEDEIQGLCVMLIKAGERLLSALGSMDNVTEDFFHELALLTLGAQLDGSYRVIVGQKAVAVVRELIMDIVKPKNPEGFQEKGNEIEFNNAANRRVIIRFGSDPDILVSERSGN